MVQFCLRLILILQIFKRNLFQFCHEFVVFFFVVVELHEQRHRLNVAWYCEVIVGRALLVFGVFQIV